MIPILPAQLDWPSAIGNFILNYGVLDWHMLVFLEARLRADDFTRIKGKPFQERVAMVKSLLASAPQSQAQRTAIDKLFIRLEPIRELRNHIAHGHLLCRSAEDAKMGKLTLSLPRDLDANAAPETRHLEFAELEKALTELSKLIQEFQRLSGSWTFGDEASPPPFYRGLEP